MLEAGAQRIEQVSHHLQMMAAMTREFGATQDMRATMKRGLEEVCRDMHAEAASVFMVDPERGDLECRACHGPVNIEGLRLPANKGIVGRTVNTCCSELVRDVLEDPDFGQMVDEKTGFVTRSIICAPMVAGGEVLGAVEILNKTDGSGLFTEADRVFLEALASAAAMAIQNVRMAAQLMEQERVRRELELAGEIQRGLLPRVQPDYWPIAGFNRPAYEVSGDFFDVVPLPDGRFWFVVADVAGKGVNAALMMAKTASLFRALAKTMDSPSVLFGRINAELVETATGGMFVTMAGGVFDPDADRVFLANAGHEPPLLQRRDTFQAFDASAPPLGILSDLSVETEEVALEGGTLYLFTDGVTEAESIPGRQLGTEGVQRLILNMSNMVVSRRAEAIGGQIISRSQILRDDVTILALQAPDPVTEEVFSDLVVSAEPDSLAQIRSEVRRAIRRLRLPDRDCDDIVLAIDEACQNVIRHAYKGEPGDMRLILKIERDRYRQDLTVEILDRAPPIDPAVCRGRDYDDIRPGGLGMNFIREVMQQVSWPKPFDGYNNRMRLKRQIG